MVEIKREEPDAERIREVVPKGFGSTNYYTVFPPCCHWNKWAGVWKQRWKMA